MVQQPLWDYCLVEITLLDITDLVMNNVVAIFLMYCIVYL